MIKKKHKISHQASTDLHQIIVFCTPYNTIYGCTNGFTVPSRFKKYIYSYGLQWSHNCINAIIVWLYTIYGTVYSVTTSDN